MHNIKAGKGANTESELKDSSIDPFFDIFCQKSFIHLEDSVLPITDVQYPVI